jgi:hypothetical protein
MTINADLASAKGGHTKSLVFLFGVDSGYWITKGGVSNTESVEEYVKTNSECPR